MFLLLTKRDERFVSKETFTEQSYKEASVLLYDFYSTWFPFTFCLTLNHKDRRQRITGLLGSVYIQQPETLPQ